MTIAQRRMVEARTPETGLGALLRETYMAFNRAFRAELGVHGLTFGQFRHLRILGEVDGIAQAELSARIGIPRAESTGVLEALEAAGLIRRVRDAEDRRRQLVFLTPKGRALGPKMSACAQRINRLARTGLDASEQALLFDLLARVRSNLA